MAGAKHTPGPWAYDWASGEVYHDDGKDEAVCPLIATVDTENTTPEQAEADGHLIAAAPDLLAALTALRNECSGTPRPSVLVALLDLADTAIAKAEGRSDA